MAKILTKWNRCLFSNIKVRLHVSLLFIVHFDMAQENRPFSARERGMRARLKRNVIVLDVLKWARKKKNAPIENLKEGDANTKAFHIR
jgi:hypothetical protein